MAMALVALAAACSQNKDYKAERDEVMKFHDIVMQDQGVVVGNQMKLDSLMKDLKGLKKLKPDLDTLKEKKEMVGLIAKLAAADEEMNAWMHQFEPDVTGKSNDVAVKYFQKEKVKIAKIDSLYKQEIKISNDYLTKLKK